MTHKHLLMLGAVAGAAYLLHKHTETADANAGAAAAAASLGKRRRMRTNALPTDSMMPGVMPAAVTGQVTDFDRQAQTAQMQGMLGYY